MSRQVEAAGGVVLRAGAPGHTEVLVVHRPRYDDWTLPKGKLHRDERPRAAAVREVAEETGVRCITVARLPDVRYVLPDGRPKRVRWWTMRPVDPTDGPAHETDDMADLGADGGSVGLVDDEVDEVRWVPVAEAAALLDHPSDVDTLAAALVDES